MTTPLVSEFNDTHLREIACNFSIQAKSRVRREIRGTDERTDLDSEFHCSEDQERLS